MHGIYKAEVARKMPAGKAVSCGCGENVYVSCPAMCARAACVGTCHVSEELTRSCACPACLSHTCLFIMGEGRAHACCLEKEMN